MNAKRAVVDLDLLIDALFSTCYEGMGSYHSHYSSWFVDSQTGAVKKLPDDLDEDELEEYDDWIPEGYFRLPSKSEINEYGMMEEFYQTMPNRAISNKWFLRIGTKPIMRSI